MLNFFLVRKLFQLILLSFFCLSYTYANSSEVIWSILICTLQERSASFTKIYNHLQKQIADLKLQEQVEVLYFLDNREHTIGFKRNALLAQSKGKYVCFVDDDDAVSDDYINNIYQRLLRNPDCVGIVAYVTYNGKYKTKIILSLKNGNWAQKNGIIYNPISHLNPIRRSIAFNFIFRDINVGEDTYWSREIVNSGLLKKEEMIDSPCYFYLRANDGTSGHLIPKKYRK